MIIKKSKEDATEKAYNTLKKYLENHEPKMIKTLEFYFSNSKNAITFGEIYEAINNGYLSYESLEKWKISYSNMILEKLYPAWLEAMNESISFTSGELYGSYKIEPSSYYVKEWTKNRTAELLTNSTAIQQEAIRAVIQRFTVIPDLTVDQVAQNIRTIVGLNKQQAVANARYFQFVKESMENNGASVEKSIEQATKESRKYAARQHRYRAQMVARTEICAAYNNGARIGIQQAVDDGIIGYTEKESVSARDDRVCPICKKLDGTRISLEQLWPVGGFNGGGVQSPPYHPHCRCINLFRIKEVEELEEI